LLLCVKKTKFKKYLANPPILFIFIRYFPGMAPFLLSKRLPAALISCILTLILPAGDLLAQVAGFTCPDTVYTGAPVTITNTTTGGSTFYWSFCTGNTLSDPVGTNIGNPGGLLNIPSYPTLVKSGTTCYSFITNQGTQSVIRYNHGTSFSNNPVSWTNLGTMGYFNDSILGIKICNNNGQWIGFVTNNNRIVRLNFGASPGNAPTASLLGPYAGLYIAHCIEIINDNGTWVGYVTSWGNNKLFRLNFGNNLLNTPVVTDLGSPGALNAPGVFRIISENGTWYGLVSNMSDHTMTRLTFGASLLNNPTGQNIGVVCPSVSPGGLALIRDCESTAGFYLNYSLTSPDKIWRLNFPSGITGPVTGTSLGNIGGMTQPTQFSEVVRVGDTLFLYNTNRQGTLTRLRFLPCSNASVPSSVLFNPPVFSYSQPGTYNVQLIVNEGQASQSSICKNIVVMTPTTITASFTAPDTVYTGNPVNITNLSTGGTTYYWSFCSGNALSNPLGVNIGNPGSLLNIPGYITLVQGGTSCYSFITNQGTSSVVRYNHGATFSNNPVSSTNLGGFGLLGDTCMGIKVCYDNGQWIGFVNNNNRLMRMNFGASLANTPTAVTVGPWSMLLGAHCLDIQNEAGTWIGFITCGLGNKFVRLNFGTSLLNTPVLTDFGAPGSMNFPGPFRLVQENGNWYGLVVNTGNNTMTRLTFGSSLLNTPTGVNVGVVCPSISAAGIALIRDCEGTTGFQLNYSLTSPDKLWRLSFPTGITGPISGTSLGNIGGMTQPAQFSELFRVADTLFLYNTNRQGTLCRLRFLPCSNASVSSSTLFTPPVYSYNQPGTYNIQLIVNEGLPNQASFCKNIVVVNAPVTITAAFTAPDTVCTGSSVNITNQSTTGQSYYWSFCSGNAQSTPLGTNIGNPGAVMNIPGYITLAKDGTTCYSFITNQGNKSVTRYNHGTSFSNNPVTWTNLGGFGMIGDTVEDISLNYDNGQWIGLVNNNNRIVRLNFGTSLANMPTATLLGPFSMLNVASSLNIFKEGGNWFGYITCSTGNKLVRIYFGSSLLNTPTLTDLGIPGSLNMPTTLRFLTENGIWYGLVPNYGNNTMTRLTFGTSLLNDPTGVNLGSPCSTIVTPGGIAVIHDCENTTGFQLNYSASSPDAIWRLTFPTGITGPVTGASMGNIGAMSRPSVFSSFFRVQDTLFIYLTNRQNFTLTRLRFLPCTNASVPSSILYSPPSYSYNQPGNYNILLIVNEGLTNEASICKQVVVMSPPVVNLGPDRLICPGTTATLDAGAGFYSYLWSTGATTQTIATATSGNYWVKVTKYGCEDYDTVAVALYPGNTVNLGPDQTVCQGQSVTFNAGACNGCFYTWSNLTLGLPNIGNSSTYTTGSAGVYSVTVNNTYGCIARDTVALFTNPTPTLTNWPLYDSVCSGTLVNINLVPDVPGANFSWTVTASSPGVTGWFADTGTAISQTLQNATGSDQTVTYHISPFIGTCFGPVVDYIVTVKPIPVVVVLPPSQSVCNGSNATFSLLSGVSTTTYGWSASATSGAVSGFSSGTGPSASQTLYNSGPTIENVIYTIMAVAEGCQAMPVIYPVPVVPAPDFTITPPSQTICSGNPTSINLTPASPLATFSWTASLTSGNISGFSGGILPVISQTLVNNDIVAGSVTYIITASIDNCFSQPANCKVTVNPAPALTNAGLTAEMCSGSFTGFSLYANVAGTQFTWTASGSSPDLSGFMPGNGTSIVQQLFNSGYTSPTVTYTVTPAALGCNGAPGTYTETVHPIPDLSFAPATTTVCTGTPYTILLNSQAQPALFSWTATGSSPFITNYSGGSGASILQAPVNTGSVPETVTYTVTPVSFGCTGSPLPYVATINPTPVVTAGPYPSSLCSGDNFTVSFNSATPGASFTWTSSASSPAVTGYLNGNGGSISNTLVNPGPAAETVTYTVIPHANGCNGSPIVLNILVKPNPGITASPTLQSLCYGQQAQITLTASLPGALCSWTASGSSPAVTGYSGGAGNQVSQVLYTTGNATQTVTYMVSSALNGCTGTSTQSVVVTYPVPDLIITPPVQSICSGQFTGITLQSLLPGESFQWTASGSPSVTGYSANGGNSIVQQLNNSQNTLGWVIYTVTPAVAGCTGPSSAVNVNVQPNPSVSFTPCSDTITTTAAKPVILRGGLPLGGVYSGTGVAGGSGLLNPASSGAGVIHVTYTYTNAYGCSASKTATFRVLQASAFSCGSQLTDVRNNSKYSTFQLPNGKCWMKQNLEFGVQISELIPQTDNCIAEFYRNPNAGVANPKSGYQWDELMRYDPTPGTQGVCPPGWHVPEAWEWSELVSLNTGPGQAAGPLMDTLLASGFHSYQHGFLYLNNTWAFATGLEAGSMYWTSTPSGADRAVARGMNDFQLSVSLYGSSRENAFAVRCVHD